MQTVDKFSSSTLPVFILTGFLGSGKTTLLRELMQLPEYGDTALIINEFGDIGLDHVLLATSDDRNIVLLESGCLCCVMNNSLQDCLESLYFQRLRQEIPSFQRIVIETSGLANPLPLISTLAVDLSIRRHYHFRGVITVIDALNICEQLTRWQESAIQLAVADRLVISKTDLLTPSQITDAISVIQAENPTAVLSVGNDASTIRTLLVGWREQIRFYRHDSDTGQQVQGTHLLKQGIRSYTLNVTNKLCWEDYAAWVTTLQEMGEQILRVKGIIQFEDGHYYALHAVHHLFYPPEYLSYPVPEPQRGVVVIVTQDIDDKSLKKISVF